MKMILILSLFLSVFMVGCASHQLVGVGKSAQLTYTTNQIVVEYKDEGYFYSPIGIYTMCPDVEVLRERGYNEASAKGLSKDQIMFVNEYYIVNPFTDWSKYSMWCTLYISNFGDYKYSTTVIKK